MLKIWKLTWCVNLQVELSCPKEMAWKVNMHRGYLAICNPEEQQLNFIERLVEMASSLAIREWRRLPHIVSHVHTPLLQVSVQTALGLAAGNAGCCGHWKVLESGNQFIVISTRGDKCQEIISSSETACC